MTRSEAAKKGLNRYFSSRKCRYGHDEIRYTNSGACVGCISGYGRQRYSTVRSLRNGLSAPTVLRKYQIDARDVTIVDEFVAAINTGRQLTSKTTAVSMRTP